MTPLRKISLALAGYILIIGVGYFTSRDDFLQLSILFGALFLGYILFLKKIAAFGIREIVLVAILFRVSLLLAAPNLSDDFWRFIWDGRLLAAGENPYLYLPLESADDPTIAELDLKGEVYTNLNSKQYYTVYPPLNQVVFAASAFVGCSNPMAEVFVLRLILLAVEIGVMVLLIRLLRHFQKDEKLVAWYALNPLVIVEIIGNLHFEGLMLFFILLAIWLWTREKILPASIALAAAISTKLLPLILIPMLPKFLGWKKAMTIGVISVSLFVLSFSVFVSQELIENFGSSIDLYFRSFEFNASIYYLSREVGYWVVGYNVIQYIGPGLSLVALLSVLAISLLRSRLKWNVFQMICVGLSIYFLLATTVHPWYMITLVGLAPLCGWRFPLLWSGVAILSYSHYAGGGFEENYFLITIEYIVLLVGAWFLDFENKSRPMIAG